MGDRVLIKPAPIEKVTPGGIVIPDTETEKYALAQSIGTLVAVGPDAWIDHVEKNAEGAVTKVSGYTEPFALPGERICFAKYGGIQMTGKDGETYRLCNDTDVTAKVDPEVDSSNLVSRKAF